MARVSPSSRRRRRPPPSRRGGEALDLAAGVDDALGAGEERVADGAHLGLQLGAGRSGGEGVAAEAAHHRISVVFGVEAGLHECSWVRQWSRGEARCDPAGEYHGDSVANPASADRRRRRWDGAGEVAVGGGGEVAAHPGEGLEHPHPRRGGGQHLEQPVVVDVQGPPLHLLDAHLTAGGDGALQLLGGIGEARGR